jgi:tRNA(adenine34) deaminase
MKKNLLLVGLCGLAFVLLISACQGRADVPVTEYSTCPPAPAPYSPDPVQIEKDNIFSLLAYSVVLQDWQWQHEKPGVRGYNIGSVLVNANDEVVCWARNAVDITENESQHGEVRLITNYLQNTQQFSIKSYRLYTTLEPCAMCSGMMTLTQLYVTIYGQSDPGYGHALERLQFDSTSIDGYCPYPRPVLSAVAQNNIREQLDDAYSQAPPGTSITQWLTWPVARDIYEQAYQELVDFDPEYPENEPVLEAAIAFLEGVPEEYEETPYTVNCPPTD